MVITISIFAFLHHGDINRHFCNISASSRRVSPWLQSHRDENLDDIGHGGAKEPGAKEHGGNFLSFLSK